MNSVDLDLVDSENDSESNYDEGDTDNMLSSSLSENDEYDNITDIDDDVYNEHVNMDVNDYSVDELINMFSISKPLNMENIVNTIEPYISEHKGQANMLSFLDKVKDKLISFIQDVNDIQFPTIKTQTHVKPIEMGDINPYMNHINTRLICLDSLYRKMYWTTKSHDYISPLSITMDNVISLHVEHIEIPNSWYVFHEKKRNLIINICGGSVFDNIKIEEGNYTSQELIDEIQRKLDGDSDLSSLSISFEFIPSSRKCRITNHNNINEIKIDFNPHTNVSFEISREKSLGHYLGFEETSFTLSGKSSSGSESKNSKDGKHIVNTFGTKYIYVCIDDFTQNKTTNNVIGTTLNTDMLSLPHYYSCDISLNDQEARVVLKGNKKYRLTHAQIHTINSIQKDINNVQNRGSYVNKSIDDGNVIAKIPVRHSPSFSENIDMIVMDKDTEIMKREYFGPVNIHKFRVYLLDDSGRELDLNGQDWSISLICKNHYRNRNKS